MPAQAETCNECHQRPAQTEEQAVAAGHVGGGVLGVLGLVTGGVCEVQVHCVLGQNRYQGKKCDGKAAGDVQLGRLRRPGK